MSKSTDSTEQTTFGERRVPTDYEGQLGNGADIPTVIESDGDEERCPYCGNWYKRLSLHWTSSDCQHPPISQYKMGLLKGLMLGDGSMHNTDGYFQCKMSNKTFLGWLCTELGWLVSDLRKKKTAVEAAKSVRNGLGRNTKAKDCVDYYAAFSRTHPQLQRFSEWYSTGEIVFPADLQLTPTSLAMWYVSDGGLDWSNGAAGVMIKFTSLNESERPQAIESMLEGCGFTVQHGKSSKNFHIPHREIDDFFEYIGDPVPGFEYKWAYEDRDRYDRLKTQMREQHCTQTLE